MATLPRTWTHLIEDDTLIAGDLAATQQGDDKITGLMFTILSIQAVQMQSCLGRLSLVR